MISITNKPRKLIYLNNTDIMYIYNTALEMAFNYVMDNVNIISKPNFHELIYSDVYNLLLLQISNIYSYKLDNIIEDTIENAFKTFYFSIMPPRSQLSVIKNNKKISIIDNKIKYLKEVPQPEQRTDEWYKMRHNLITASNAWETLGTESSKNRIILEKCKPIDKEKFGNVNTSSPMHWGQKYEPLSTSFYELKYKVNVDEFGCIPHKKYNFLGASPDGIVVSKENGRYGRMLEIKNIVNRDITGIPKKEYWIQMQLQMETCDLNECDFLETRFKEYETKEEFDNDNEYKFNSIDRLKGKILYFTKNEKPFYVYPELSFTEDDYQKWEKEMMEKYSNLTWNTTIYWKLTEISCVMVCRNELWFKNVIGEIQSVWETIEKERITGYSHREVKKRDVTKNSIILQKTCPNVINKESSYISNKPVMHNKPVCLININTEVV